MVKRSKTRSSETEDVLTQELISSAKSLAESAESVFAKNISPSKVDILGVQSIQSLSDFVKTSKLSSKKDILLKGLANNAVLKRKLNLVDNSANKTTLSAMKKPVMKQPEMVSETESSSSENETEVKGHHSSSGDHSNLSQNCQSSGRSRKNNKIKIEQPSSENDDSYENILPTLHRNKKNKSITDYQESNIIDDYARDNKLNPVDSLSKFNILEYDLDSDIFLVQLPKSMDPQLLMYREIDLDKSMKIKGEDFNFTLNIDQIPQEQAMLLSNGTNHVCNLTIVQPMGVITAHKVLKSKKKNNFLDFNTTGKKVPFPDNLKVRHPIFGIDYKKKIKVSTYVKEKLDAAIVPGKQKKKKKHIKGKNDEHRDDALLAHMFNDHMHKNNMQNDVVNKKKRKRKSSLNEKSNVIFDQTTIKLNGEEIGGSCAEESCKKQKHKNVKSEVDSNIFGEKTFVLGAVQKQKKMHKKKSGTDVFDDTTLLLSQKKTPHSNNVIANSTMINFNSTTPDFEIDLSQITSAESVKTKKVKKEPEAMNENLTMKILDQIEFDIKQKKKKHKMDVVEDEDKNGESSASNPHKKKKKKKKKKTDAVEG